MSTIISTDYITDTDIFNENSTIINNIVIFPLQMQKIKKKKIFYVGKSCNTQNSNIYIYYKNL